MSKRPGYEKYLNKMNDAKKYALKTKSMLDFFSNEYISINRIILDGLYERKFFKEIVAEGIIFKDKNGNWDWDTSKSWKTSVEFDLNILDASVLYEGGYNGEPLLPSYNSETDYFDPGSPVKVGDTIYAKFEEVDFKDFAPALYKEVKKFLNKIYLGQTDTLDKEDTRNIINYLVHEVNRSPLFKDLKNYNISKFLNKASVKVGSKTITARQWTVNVNKLKKELESR